MNKLTKGGLRIRNVQGFNGRKNDVLYIPKLSEDESNQVVLFFGGDIQDFDDNMKSSGYREWSLDAVGRLLSSKFPKCHTIVVRPARMVNTFSCYDNFVPSANDYGVPKFATSYNALKHLECLLQNIPKSVAQNARTTNNSESTFSFDESKLKLIGFSKGCVVLNQFLYEFNYNKGSFDDESITRRITDMYFLDGGHSGGSDTWITSPLILETLTKLNINIHVHVTPYQINDERRPWIRNEEKQFSEKLKKLGCNIDRVVHFEHENRSLKKHFELLNQFIPNH